MIRHAGRRTPHVSDAMLDAVAGLVGARTGLVFSAASRQRLAAAVEAELRHEPGRDPNALLTRLRGDTRRVETLAAATTVGETYFLRDAAQFEWLRRDALPSLLARTADEPPRIWCAGCASGEEPYSIAMLIRELGYRGRVAIVGSDLSAETLARARRAVYSQWSLRSVSPQTVARWFRKGHGDFTLADEIRTAVTFVRHNLATGPFPPPDCGFAEADLILCRNVLIYLDRASVTRVSEQLLDALSPDGWLLLGACDPPIADLTACEVVVTDAGLAYRRPRDRHGAASQVLDLRAAVARATARTPDDEWEWARYAATGDPTPALRAEAAPVPSDAPALAPVLAARYAGRDYTGALAVAERMLREAPTDERVWVTLVRSLANLGDLEQAGRASALALERCPLSAELTYLAGVLQVQAGHHAAAAATGRRAVYLDHTLAVAHVTLGTALARSGDAQAAVRSLASAERLLSTMAADALVPAGDGETAGAMLARVAAQRRLIAEARDVR